MNIAYFPNQIARNAPPVLEAFLHSCREAGHEPVAYTEWTVKEIAQGLPLSRLLDSTN